MPKRLQVLASKLIWLQLQTKGFTLAELLIAALITGFIAAATIGAVINVLQIDQQAESEVLRRQDLNRALDFMSDEVRRASAITVDASTETADLPSGAVPVLALTIPGISNERVVYSIKPSDDPWYPPSTIYRTGVALNADGTYSTTATLMNFPLVDAIDDDAVNNAFNSGATNTCPSGTTMNPPAAQSKGFYVCVDANGRIADIHIRAKLKGTYGGATAEYAVSSSVAARSTPP